MYIGIYKAGEDATTLAFLNRLEALDAFVQKHLDLATKVTAPQPPVGARRTESRRRRRSLMDAPYFFLPPRTTTDIVSSWP